MTTKNNLLPLMSGFAAVVKAGSFTRAASHLGLSKSVVSRHVAYSTDTCHAFLWVREIRIGIPTEISGINDAVAKIAAGQRVNGKR